MMRAVEISDGPTLVSGAGRDDTLTRKPSPQIGNISEAVAAMRFAVGVFSSIMISQTYGRAANLMVTGIRASWRFGTGPWVAGVGEHILGGNVAETITVATEDDSRLSGKATASLDCSRRHGDRLH